MLDYYKTQEAGHHYGGFLLELTKEECMIHLCCTPHHIFRSRYKQNTMQWTYRLPILCGVAWKHNDDVVKHWMDQQEEILREFNRGIEPD